ncbi:MAG: D-sedoheptulose 7-phosphate isomerase [Candidatus Schekmanbacteria bacterium]|nr:D-sedoheptulose 7-phosphate isomerase [Candidatus Schekmanbacteria bacterium]
MEKRIQAIIEESCRVKQLCANELSDQITSIVQVVCQALSNGHKILFFGNGGSAADAQHLAGELINRFLYDRRALAGLALSTDTSVLTCIANDCHYDHVFSRQIEALGKAGDVALGISTSGNSANIIRAIETAKQMSIKTVGFSGGSGGKLAQIADYSLVVPSTVTPRIQEAHITIGHIICELVEEALCPRNK